jgi:diaminopimelate epimerase
MKYYNSDGNESTMCGNGGRCITAFADFLSLHGTSYRFRASDGDHQGIILERGIDNCIVKLHMNDVPGYRRWGKDYILDTGSPHLVRFEDHVRSLNVRVEGRQIRHLSDFQPAGINVNFVEDKGDYLFVRTYERGVEDETLSCGTGVTASALAFAASGRTSEGKVRIETSGGILYVHYSRNGEGFTGIWLEGPAVRVFDGVFEI